MDRALSVGRWWRQVWLVTALVLVAGLQGCKTHEDAVAAAEQMAETAATLQQYYATLDAVVVKTAEVRRAQRYLLHGPPDPGSDARLEVRRSELAKRAVLAGDVAKISALFGEITGSRAADDAAKYAEDLRQQAAGLKLIADNDAVQKALQGAVTSLVNLVRAHDEVKAAKALDPVLVALCNLFDTEKAVYLAVMADYYTGAAANAVVLIEKDQVSVASQYRSSLEPFGLRAEINLPELKSAAREDLKSVVNTKVAALNQDSSDSADALADALHRMEARVNTVARGGVLRVRVPPLSLEAVKAWIAELQTLSGVSL